MKHLKNRKYLCLSLALASVLAAAETLPAMAAEYPYSQYLSGENAQNLPESESGYTLLSLSTEADLLQLAADCQLDSWSRDKYIRLENDITLEENTGIVIPSFGGIFDGNGHTISGLHITASGSALGLFRYIQSSGTLQNLTVSGTVLPDGEGSRSGILAGVNYGLIQNCSVSGKITGSEEIGGICGVNEASGEIRRCQSAAVITGEHYTGGIAGRLHQGYIQNCTNTGHVLGRKDVGGIAGQMEPFLEIQFLNDKLSEIDRETQVFFDLLEASNDDLHRYSQEASDLVSGISSHLTNAAAAAGNLMGTANELWYLYNQELTGINNDLSRLNQELGDQAARDKAEQDAAAEDTDSGQLQSTVEQHENAATNPRMAKSWNLQVSSMKIQPTGSLPLVKAMPQLIITPKTIAQTLTVILLQILATQSQIPLQIAVVLKILFLRIIIQIILLPGIILPMRMAPMTAQKATLQIMKRTAPKTKVIIPTPTVQKMLPRETTLTILQTAPKSPSTEAKLRCLTFPPTETAPGAARNFPDYCAPG